jgi:aerobic carbon-monoxide dehydrogenase large subunit
MDAEAAALGGRWVGQSVPRVEDRRHLTGDATFVDDIRTAGVLHVAFARSPHPAARIEGIDTAEAVRAPGVRAVLTAADLELEPLTPMLNRPEFVPVELPMLAAERVRHAGEPVAMVIADSPHAAEDATELIVVDYEPEDAVASIEAALEDDAQRVHEQLESNVLLDVPFADDPELDDVLAGAELVVEAEYSSGRLTAVPLEGRACLAEWERGGQRVVLHTSTQIPHVVRTTIAGVLGVDEHRVRVVAPDVGGGFGQKCVVAREEVLVCVAARAVGAPVKWVEDRAESLLAGFQGHEQRFTVTAGFDAGGRMLAVDADIVADVGAYSTQPFTCGVEPLMAATEMLGPYRVEHYRCRTRAVATNKAPMAPYRGVARPQMVLAMERLLQKAAVALELELDEIHLRNLAREFPHVSATGLSIDEGSYHESVELCARTLDLPAFRERQRAAREEGRLLGLGLSVFAERTGYGTEAFAQRKMAITPGYEGALARMDPSGSVLLAVGTSGHGQGHQTTLAQVAADRLGLTPDRVEVRQGDTDATPYGWGTFASRSMVVGGGATQRAADRLADRLRMLAAHMLEADPEDLELRDGEAVVRGAPGKGVAFQEIARLAYLETHRLPEGVEPGLECTASFDPPGTFSNACHGAIVEIDPETAGVRIERYLVVEDCGVMVNPAIVEGQVRGGVAQGIAAALYEALAYGEDGQLQNASLMDYLVPTAWEIPPIEILHLETPSAFSETGAKGMGEGGTMGAPACIATAVNDALAHLGAGFDRIPITPDGLYEALREREQA